MRRALLLVLAIPWLCAAIPDTPPPPLELSATEQALIADGGAVVRIEPGTSTSGGATGIVDIAASVDDTWAALLDLSARVGEIGGLKKVDTYLQEPERVGARWELKVLTVTVVFHCLYELDRANGWVRYSLDRSQSPNNLAAVEGAYQVFATETGSRLIYRSESDSGRRVPQWIKRWLVTDSLREQLDGIRARAETGG